ncbi:pseudaminic acid cytidylyltransferase [Treponema sp. C6A8]|uniref:pseudaminic acid cytidylyltransferase n=1 Tax=Treponema sp. C6A8 TaxID=1410609 RepID=UPI00048306A3|nr:pseudaminic acid cytidylyltransferase [Treponema sp. C6A8]
MSIIAIITARGGSKRIPKKNIKPFMGKPMLAYAIEAAKESGLFEEIMVSTDSEEIANVSKEYGAKVPFMRSERTSNDFATTFDVLEEVITEYKKQGFEYEELCCIYPCVPFLTSKTLRESYIALKQSNADALQPVCRYPAPVEWAMKIEDGLLIPNDKNAQLIRSQDLIPKFYDVGMFYYLETNVMLSEKTITPNKTLAYIINEQECQDIDTQDDWKMAEMKYKLLHLGE